MSAQLSSCVISYFYIKPQPDLSKSKAISVVLYLTSTSNHNPCGKCYACLMLCYILLLHQTTTDRCHRISPRRLCYILLLHQTTTWQQAPPLSDRCVISYFYIKPQLQPTLKSVSYCCVISYFYIKPQLTSSTPVERPGCVISYFYIKPQPIWDNPLRWKPLRDSFVYRKWCWCVTFYGQKY